MATTLIAENEYPLTWEDCIDYLSDKGAYLFKEVYVHRSQRLGQAWMNSLGSADYVKLAGSFYDPFYRDDHAAVIRALQFLLEN